MEMKKNTEKLKMWQERLEKNRAAYSAELSEMGKRERLYRGERQINPISRGDKRRRAAHVCNITAELIESQFDSSVPQPKVTALRREDEKLAHMIEDMLKCEAERLRLAEMNDMLSRTVPIQGGGFCLVQWDSLCRSHEFSGEVAISAVHPKQVIPQDGIYTDVCDMDYIIISVPQTQDGIYRRYGIRVDSGNENGGDELITQYIAYYKNGKGGIGAYSWADDTELFDYEDSQARRLRRCDKCGAENAADSDKCTYCGGTRFSESEEEYEYLWSDVKRSDGSVIPSFTEEETESGKYDEYGLPIYTTVPIRTAIPYYKPDIYPVVLMKNVSVYGKLLGESDVDKIADQQNTMNRIESKIIDKLTKAGSYITLPDEASIRFDSEDMKVIRPGNAAAKAMIDVYSLEGDVSQDMAYLAHLYDEAKQAIGITDSYMGRSDDTAISGKAKLIAVEQSAGRFESKRVMKNIAFSKLYELIFKFRLAYADEPRPVLSRDTNGNVSYENFNRYDFLCRDEAGEWYWNDNFIFSTEQTPTVSTRENMWEKTEESFRTGAFGDPSSLPALVLFWSKMELLHYPGAEETKKYLLENGGKEVTANDEQNEIVR